MKDVCTHLLCVSLHVVEGVLIAVHQNELVSVEVESGPYVQVLRPIILGQLRAEVRLVRALHPSSLQEPTPNDPCRQPHM